MESIKDRITDRVDDVRSGMNSLRSSDFGDVFFWQEVSKLADDKLKKAWTDIQGSDKKRVLEDDAMRALGEGEHVVTSSKLFAVTAKVAAPALRFDVKVFIEGLMTAYPKVIKRDRLLALIEAAKVAGKSSLTKRVVEKVKP